MHAALALAAVGNRADMPALVPTLETRSDALRKAAHSGGESVGVMLVGT
ncbi:MAG: hypothetical protein AVDCRST_MAG17-1532 [uncultured Solirubrobacterales bacterium]|uniref:Uncharacterized protein n=1 Tax=uncultured Solirubrobacterales bacterium TaxID=768556 RepID=A0A6J4SRN4_9ACTN|nr:MAG: hypothetical protein AVDCRST_MAG17-1532 [uncultured Solirubrobacterales bacterium]